jgi:outer membrane lipoprotein-sorting protein
VAVCRASVPRRPSNHLGRALAALLLAGCAIAPPTLRAPIPDDARRAIDQLTARWREFDDLRALAEVTLSKGGERQHLSGALLARAPASLRFEALSPFGQPFLLVTVHNGRLLAYNASTNEASVGDATAETAANLLSLPVEPDEFVALLAGRAAPPKDLRVAEVLAPDELGPSITFVGRYNRQRVWMDLETGVVRQVTITGGRVEATVSFQRGADGVLTGFDLSAANGYVTGAVRYRTLALNGGVDAERFGLTLPKDAKIQGIR